jgi:mRNA interferase RelE/StbE
MSYSINISKKAAKDIRKLDREIAEQIIQEIQALEEEPRPANSKQLSGYAESIYRLRKGPYRIVYAIDEPRQDIYVGLIGHRTNIYDRLKRSTDFP